ncbi:Protein dachsous [Halotydeus destructor]|nr:Protein dachsous [Halotydeus destructor]
MPFLKIGRVMASDRDLGADGKVQYYLRSSSPAMSLSKFRINPSTGLLSVSTLLADDLPPKHSSLIIEASSGRENSLSALTVVQITLKIVDDIASNRIYDGPLRPDDLTQPAVTPTSSSSIPGWILFLIVLLMLVTVVLLFSIVVIRLYHQQQEAMMGRSQCSFGMNTLLRKRGGGSSLDLGPEGTPTYVHHEGDHVMHAHHHHHGHHPGGYIISSAATAPPPCYNEVTLTSSNLEGRSASSGRGSAEDEEDVDEEIRMIIEGNDYYGDGTENDCADGRDSAVPTTAEYLARLGVAQHGDDEMVETLNENDDVMSEDLHNVKINRPTQFSSVRSCRTRAQGSKGRRNRSQSQREPEDWSQLCPDSVAIQAQEELVEAYSWDYLQNWCPQYQPLSSVFTEIAKLKGAEIDPNDSANHFYDSASINSRMETASTMSTSTTRSGGRRRHQAQASPMTNPLIQASSTSAFSPVRPM